MKVLAAVDGDTSTGSILDVAGGIAGLLGAGLEAVHVGDDVPAAAAGAARERGAPLRTVPGPEAGALGRAAQEPDVAALVVGARGLPHGPRPAGRVTEALMTSLPGPLVVVPPTTRAVRRLRRILVALNGSPEATDALRPVTRAALDAGLAVVVVHVFDPRAAPAFADQPHHWSEAYLQEFRARNVVSADAEVHLRAGDPPERLLDAAKQLDADLIALAWSQTLAPGHAAVVRSAIAEGEIPVLLVPVGPA
jgi:nucleotide-binding universal stress UspA family protein